MCGAEMNASYRHVISSDRDDGSNVRSIELNVETRMVRRSGDHRGDIGTVDVPRYTYDRRTVPSMQRHKAGL